MAVLHCPGISAPRAADDVAPGAIRPDLLDMAAVGPVLYAAAVMGA